MYGVIASFFPLLYCVVKQALKTQNSKNNFTIVFISCFITAVEDKLNKSEISCVSAYGP